MSLSRRIVFIAIVVSILWLLHAVVYAVTARVFGYELPYWQAVLAGLALSFILANVFVRRFDSVITNGFYVTAVTWLGVLFLLFSATSFYELWHLIMGDDNPRLLAVFLLVGGVASVYALFNANHLVTKSYTIPLTGITAPVKLVHLSDIHIGTVHQEKFLKRVVEKTNALTPDLVLMTGDLFDGSAPIHEEMLHALNSLKAPCFFSHGNHEEYEGLAHVTETVFNLHLQLLDNKVATWSGLQIVGVNDAGSLRGQTLASVLDTLPLDHSKPTILMYHTPVNWGTARGYGIELMLSGHTHNGQIWPFTLLVRLRFKYVMGLYEKAGKYLHVTPGTGTWGPPMRLGSNNQITLINLVPKSGN